MGVMLSALGEGQSAAAPLALLCLSASGGCCDLSPGFWEFVSVMSCLWVVAGWSREGAEVGNDLCCSLDDVSL